MAYPIRFLDVQCGAEIHRAGLLSWRPADDWPALVCRCPGNLRPAFLETRLRVQGI